MSSPANPFIEANFKNLRDPDRLTLDALLSNKALELMKEEVVEPTRQTLTISITQVYKEFLEKPNSPVAHKFLHTHYHERVEKI